MLARFFKPKWQHPKPAIRIKAVARLRANDQQAHEILCNLALQDKDESVRLAATEKLLDLPLLVKISRREAIDSIRQQALHQISQLLLKTEFKLPLETRLEAVNSLSDSDLLCHITLNAKEPELARQALQQLRSDSHLLTIARQCQRAALRIEAAEKLNCPELLEQLNRHARGNDKSVFRITRDKINEFRQQEKQQQQDQAIRQRLLEALSQLARDEHNSLYQARLTALQQEWAELVTPADSDDQVRFLRLQASCETILEEAALRQQAELAAEKQRQQNQQRQTALLQRLQLLHEKFSTSEIRPANLEFLAADFNLLQDEYRTLITKHQDRSPCKKLYDQLQQQIQAWQAYQSQQDCLQQAIDTLKATLQSDDGQLKKAERAAQQLRQAINWPDSLQPAPLLIALEQQLNAVSQRHSSQQKQVQQQQQKLQQQLNRLAESIKAGAVTDAEKLLKRTERDAQKLDSLSSQLEQQLRTLTTELQELHDWQAFAVTPKKEALCSEMEALATSEQSPEQRALVIKQLQKTWKQLDATDPVHDQQIWKRFKQASDLAYAPCDEHFAAQRKLRQENLQRRQKICEHLKLMLADPDNIEPAKLAGELHEVRQAWRSFTPVDRAPGKQLQQEFNQLLKQLENPLKQARKEVLQAKEELVAKSAALLESEDIAAAASMAKQLQADWKQLAFAPRHLEQPLWEQFRSQCDEIFQRLSQQQSEQSSELPALEQTLQQLEQLPQQANSLTKMQEILTTAQQQFKVLNTGHPAYHRGKQRIEAAGAFINHQHTELQALLTPAFQALQHNGQLCETVEDAILADEDTVAALARAEQEWRPTKTLPDDLAEGIRQRLNCLQHLVQHPADLDQILTEQETRLRQLCIRLEIACQQPTPPEDQTLRMEYQLQRLQHALEQQQLSFSLADIKQLEYEWLCTPFADHFEALHQRFYTLLEPLLIADTVSV